MPTHHADHALELFAFESPNTMMLAFWNALSCWMSETIPSTFPQRRDHIIQTVCDVDARVEMLIRHACDTQGRCTIVRYRRRVDTSDHASPHSIDAQELAQSIVHVLRQRSRAAAIDYLAAFIGIWCLVCPASLAQPYLLNGHDLTDAEIARRLLMWTFRPLDYWN